MGIIRFGQYLIVVIYYCFDVCLEKPDIINDKNIPAH